MGSIEFHCCSGAGPDASAACLDRNHLAGVTAIVLLGGIKSIGKISSYLVPIMALMYVLGGLIILALRCDKIPESLYSDCGVGIPGASGNQGAF